MKSTREPRVAERETKKLLTWRKAVCADSRLNANGRLVLLVLSLYVDAAWSAFPSQKTLAKDCALSERTVRDELTAAREFGWLTRKTVGRPRGWHYAYTLTLPTGTDFRPEDGSDRSHAPTGADFRTANHDRPTGKSAHFQPEPHAAEVEEQEVLKREDQQQEQEPDADASRVAPLAIVAPSAGGSIPPKVSKPRRKREDQTLTEFLDGLEPDEEAIPGDDPLLEELEAAGVSIELAEVAWFMFETKYRDNGKRYRDWRTAFRDHVRNGWIKAWWFTPEGEAKLTTPGEQARRVMAARDANPQGARA